MRENCLICKRLILCQKKENPHLIRELTTGYAVIGDHQFFDGYTLFLCKKHVTELHFLEPTFRKQFLYEMSLVAQAVHLAFQPKKLNYELLGNSHEHLHWHIFPRYGTDPHPNGPVWRIPKQQLYADSCRPSIQQLEQLKAQMNVALEQVLSF